jgi:FkbM family methyltransferase
MNKSWENDWNRVKGYSSYDRTHHNEVVEIIKNIEFDCFIDCGPGNVGSEAWSVNDLKPDCTIIGFEPQNERYDLLKNNSYPGKLLKLVVGQTCGEVVGFMGHETGKTDFWLHGGEIEGSDAYNKTIVNSVTIDKIVEDYNLGNKKIFIWADIEGSEMDMLLGAKKSLENDLIMGLTLELTENWNGLNLCNAQTVIDLLLTHKIVSLTPRQIIGTHKDFLFKRI